MRLTHIIAIDFRYCWLLLKKSLKWVILSAALVLLIASLVISSLEIETSYRATATLYSFGNANMAVIGLETLQRYSGMIKSRRIAKEVSERLEDPELTIDEIYEMLSTEPRYVYTSTLRYDSDLTVIPVYADSPDSARCIEVANAAALAFASDINGLLGTDVIEILDYANSAEAAENKKIVQAALVIAISLLAGLLTILCILLRVILSSRIQTMTDLSYYGQIPILGVLPENRN